MVGLICYWLAELIASPALSQVLAWGGPLAWLIYALVMAFSSRVNPSKRGFFRAMLIVTLIIFVLAFICVLLFMPVFMEILSDMGVVQLL